MPLVDRKRLGADLVKLVWHSDMVDRGDEMHHEVFSDARWYQALGRPDTLASAKVAMPAWQAPRRARGRRAPWPPGWWRRREAWSMA